MASNQAVLKIADLPLELQKNLPEFDDEGNGILEMDEVAEVFSSYKRLKEDREKGVLHICNLPTPKFQQLAAAFDANGSGTIEPFEFQRAVEMYQESQQKAKRLMRLVGVLVFFVLLVLACIAGLTFAVVELSKETKMSSDGTMTLKDSDEVVKVSSADTRIGSNNGTASMLSADGDEMTMPASKMDIALKYTVPFELIARMEKVTVNEAGFQAIGMVGGVTRTSSRMVIVTDVFTIRMLKDPPVTIIEPLEGESIDLEAEEQVLLEYNETTRRHLLQALDVGPRRRLLEASSDPVSSIGDSITVVSDTEAEAPLWEVVENGRCCGAGECDYYGFPPKLEDGTPVWWRGIGRGLEDCKEACARSPTCQGIEYGPDDDPPNCNFKVGMWENTIRRGCGDRCTMTNQACTWMPKRVFAKTTDCAFGDPAAPDIQIDGLLWAFNGKLYAKLDGIDNKPADSVSQGVQDDPQACGGICMADEDCAAIRMNMQTKECFTYTWASTQAAHERELFDTQPPPEVTWAKVCLNEDPGGKKPPEHIKVQRWNQCKNRNELTKQHLPVPAEGWIDHVDDCKRAVMNNLGTLCANPGDPLLLGYSSGSRARIPGTTTQLPDFWRSGKMASCYCVPPNSECEPIRNLAFAVYYMDPKPEDLTLKQRYNVALQPKWGALQGATFRTPVPENPLIELVATKKVCMNVKVLMTLEERETPARGFGVFMTVDQCMERALNDPDCLAHGPTIQFHDYGSIGEKPRLASVGSNGLKEYLWPSERVGAPDEAVGFLDWNCACSLQCELDRYSDRDNIERGTCEGEIRGINQPEEMSRSENAFPNEARALPITISDMANEKKPVYVYPPMARFSDIQNDAYATGHCLDPAFQYTMTEDDLSSNERLGRATTNIYTLKPSEEPSWCVDVSVGSRNKYDGIGCAASMTYSVPVTAPALCGDRVQGARITYTGEPCGDGKILWTSMATNDANGIPLGSGCAWSAAGKDNGWRNMYTGSCGVAPAVAGVGTASDGLPTSCREGGLYGKWEVPVGYHCPHTVDSSNGSTDGDIFHVYHSSADDKNYISVFRAAGGYTWAQDLTFQCCRKRPEDYAIWPEKGKYKVSVGINTDVEWISLEIPIRMKCPALVNKNNWIGAYTSDHIFITKQDFTGSQLQVKKPVYECDMPYGWDDMYLEFYCEWSIEMNDRQQYYGKLNSPMKRGHDGAPLWDDGLGRGIPIPRVTGPHDGYHFTVPAAMPPFDCGDGNGGPATHRAHMAMGIEDTSEENMAMTFTPVGPNEYVVRRADENRATEGWDFTFKARCLRAKEVKLVVGPNWEPEGDGWLTVTQKVPPGYTCPGTITKNNWLGSDIFPDTFQLYQRWSGELRSSESSIQVKRTDVNGEGWGLNLEVHCAGWDRCVRPDVGMNKEGGKKVFTVPEGYICPPKVSKDNWYGGWQYPYTFTIAQDGTSVEVVRDGCVENGNSWDIPLQFDCCDSQYVCQCETPRAGTVGANRYFCNDGTAGYCPATDECYAEFFRKNAMEEGCRRA